jgi:hypothetical protein
LCLPSVTGGDLTPDGMNWTCLVYGGPMLAVMIWWVIDARKWFTGPVVNVSHAIHAVPVDGVEPEEQRSMKGDTVSNKAMDV